MNLTLGDTVEALEVALKRKLYRAIDFFQPYPKQQEFFDLGLTMRERLLMAANQVGKTYCGAAEMVFHLTGEYPEDWFGRRWDRPIKAWACGITAKMVRDVQQKLLFGEAGVISAFGTGLVPKAYVLDKPTLARGETDAFDSVQIEHRTNGVVDGVSILRFKSYVQGREAFQGDTIDLIWCDEEPDETVYSEILTRITATNGMVYITFTPLKGMSKVVLRFMEEVSPDRGVVVMTIEDAQHIKPEERARIIAGYPAHEREARARGVPMLGSGMIFPTPEETISEPALAQVPLHWAKLWGIDFGIDHPFAAVLIAWDRDADVIHVLHTVRMVGALPMAHAAAIKSVAAYVPIAWPHDGHARDKGSGEALASQYTAQGLVMLGNHATWPDGSVSVEAGLLELDDRMQSGRFKVAGHLSQWFEEKRQYHRKDGAVIKLRDDLLDATRMATMMKRYAKPIPLGPGSGPRTARGSQVARNVDFDPF